MTNSPQSSIDRPKMPKSYGLSQNVDGQLKWEWV